jgi:hypothetical protein
MNWEYTPRGVLAILNDYHLNKYPDDKHDDWKIHYSAEQNRDAYLMVLQYMNPGRLGHMYAKLSIDGMAIHFFQAKDDISGWIKFICHDFDTARMEIIECLDEQIVNQPKRVVELIT